MDWFLNTAPVNLIENVPINFFKKIVVSTVSFSVTTGAIIYFYNKSCLYRKLLSLIKGDYSNVKYFNKCNITVG